MATISYKCDTCKRETELVENKFGFTVVGKCNITEGCLGKLYKIARNPNNVRESSPTFVEGLSNYIPRRALYTFTQNIPSDIWEVTHNMGVLPATFVYINQNNNLSILDNEEYSVSAINKDKISVSFSKKYTGTIQCVARSTVPQIPYTLPSAETLTQVSANGIFTFGVPKYITYTDGPYKGSTFNVCSSNKPIRIEIEIIKPNEEPYTCFETIQGNIPVKSPWNTWDEILVNRRRNYCVKAFEILKMKIFGTADLKITDIPNGTRIRFVNVDYGDGIVREINSRSMLALLAKYPYQYADKIKDYLVDIGEMKGETPDYFVYNNGEMFVDSTLVEKSYPDISKYVGYRLNPPPSVTPSPTVTPTLTATITPTVSVSNTPSATPQLSPTATPVPSPTRTPQPTTSFVECSKVFSGSGGSGVFPLPINSVVTLGNSTGLVTVAFSAGNIPSKMVLTIDGVEILDTGYYGDPALQADLNDVLNRYSIPLETIIRSAPAGQYNYFSFNKDTATSNVNVSVYSPLDNASWKYEISCPQYIPPPETPPSPTPTKSLPATPASTPASTPPNTPPPTPPVTPSTTPPTTPYPSVPLVYGWLRVGGNSGSESAPCRPGDMTSYEAQQYVETLPCDAQHVGNLITVDWCETGAIGWDEYECSII